MLGFVGRYTTPGGFGVPLGMRMAVRDEVLARVPRRAVVVAEGDDVIEDSEAAIWDVLLSGAKDVSIVPYTLRLMPAGQHIVLDVPLGCDGAATFKMRAVHGIAGPPRYVETCYQVRTQSPSEHPQQGLTVTDTSTFACGARVTAFRWDEATDTVMGSDWGLSPRVAKVAFYDPTRPPDPGRRNRA